ncbi:MAG: putative esterase [Rhodothermales bacterium]|jgi:predicted esterase
MTKENRESEIRDYVAYLDTVVSEVLATCVGLPEVHVLGFSQGAATASRWAALGNVKPQRLICWAGDIAHDLKQPAVSLAGTDLIVVHGSRDKLLTNKRKQAFLDRMDADGLTYRLVSFEGGHRMDTDTLAGLVAAP